MAKKHKKAPPVALVPKRPAVPVVVDQTPMGVFERFAKDPSIEVGKLERLIEAQKEILRMQAKAAFTTAFAAMQAALPVVSKRGIIKGKGGEMRSRYAKLEDIHAAVKPVLQAHGFSIRHRTEWPSDKLGIIRIVGILAHVQGHVEESAFEAPMDRSDFRTDIQSMGSTVSYGRRYTTIDLLNLTQVGVDDDGQKGRRPAPQAPPAAVNPKGGLTITQGTKDKPGQVERLWAIIRSSGRPETEIRMWLKARYGLDHTKDILRRDYEDICTAIEHPGPLPLPARDPGEDG